jgi:hypothetical protein
MTLYHLDNIHSLGQMSISQLLMVMSVDQTFRIKKIPSIEGMGTKLSEWI